MSILLTLLQRNVPLHRCREFKTAEDLSRVFGGRLFAGYVSEKESRAVARHIVSALSNADVVSCFAREWSSFPPRLRLDISDIANAGQCSGSVAKGVARANELLGGKLLRSEEGGPTARRLVIRDGALFSERRRINPAQTAAQALYAATERPANYHTLSKREQKEIDRDIAERRKELRSRPR